MINNRLDLEDQLSHTAIYTRESLTLIEHKRNLDKLKNTSSNLNMENDPALYTGFYERLQKILDSYKEHWDRIIEELTKLREDIGKGRTDEAGIVDSPVMPFLDLMLMEARITMNSKEIIAVAKLSELIYARIKESFSIPNFWQKPNERRRLEGDIRDELEYCGIEPLQEVAAKLTVDLINLAHKREAEVKGS